ncbi:ATP-binding protein [Streptomyces sp. SID3212]|uniref:ATP-binding protein n=1 Tax=unclassified Streptomyces TaxID=2593676 RepID=UPI00136EC247|nr:ATP-binding protein [Streptomyces sp. SID3212]
MAPGNAPTPQLITQRPGNVVRRYGFELPARAESVGRARKLTAERLLRWGMDDDTCQTAILVVSELVTNAVVHAAGDHVVCEIREGEGHLRIAVEDQGYGPTGPQMHPHSDDEGGRGLFLIDSLCTGWGAHDTSGYGPGRVVWAELPHGAARQVRPAWSGRASEPMC